MYIASCGCPSLGIEPRMPIVLGWWGALQMSTVAHSSGDFASGVNEDRASAPVTATGVDPTARAAASTPAQVSAGAILRNETIM